MALPAFITQLAVDWGSIYSNHAAVRTAVVFAHIAGLVTGGGLAIVADRATLQAARLDAEARMRQLRSLRASHAIVLISLVVIVISGVLLAGADLDNFIHSKIFWTKMGLVVLLLVNGSLLTWAERRAAGDIAEAWGWLRGTSVVSLVLWFATMLAGAALLNAG